MVDLVIKSVTASMCQRVYRLWGRVLFRGACDLYDRDLLCDGPGSHGGVKGNQKKFVPEDGQILKKTTVSFTTGESVFDILKTICGEKGIQISSKYTPLYDSYYVEGINQLYELDCGKNSGWMYSVNGTFPNYGASAYKPKDGDVILWVYTCDLGNDVGNPYQGDEK